MEGGMHLVQLYLLLVCHHQVEPVNRAWTSRLTYTLRKNSGLARAIYLCLPHSCAAYIHHHCSSTDSRIIHDDIHLVLCAIVIISGFSRADRTSFFFSCPRSL